MRFKNLTIILTLTCLSIVALAGLTFMPITEGICEWSGDESNKSYYTNNIVDGKGWEMSVSLSATREEASA